MKKILIILGICSVIFACTSGEKSANTEETTNAETVEAPATDPITVAVGSAKGEQLIGGSDCLTCHKVDTKIVGPAYVDVANKYSATEANIEMLSAKIIQGGSGVWGEIPMAPHPGISTDDAKEMIKYILGLKSK